MKENAKNLRVKNVAKKLDIGVSTVWLWIKTKDFPKPYKIGSATFWKEADVNTWLENNLERIS